MAENEEKTREKKTNRSWVNGFIIALLVIGIILILAGAIYESTISEGTPSDEVRNVSITASILIVVGILLLIPFIVVRTKASNAKKKIVRAKEDERRARDLSVKINFARDQYKFRTKLFRICEDDYINYQEGDGRIYKLFKEYIVHCGEELNAAMRAFNNREFDNVERHMGHFDTLMIKMEKLDLPYMLQDYTEYLKDQDKKEVTPRYTSNDDDDDDEVETAHNKIKVYNDGTTPQDHEFFDDPIEDAELFDLLDEIDHWLDD